MSVGMFILTLLKVHIYGTRQIHRSTNRTQTSAQPSNNVDKNTHTNRLLKTYLTTNETTKITDYGNDREPPDFVTEKQSIL